MSDQGQSLQAEHTFKKLIWRSTLQIGPALEQSTTWTITGVAGLAALIISNVDKIVPYTSAATIKGALLLLTGSMLFGALSKQFGRALSNGLDTLIKLEGLLSTEQGKCLMGGMSVMPAHLVNDLAEPFLWPLSSMIRRSGTHGLNDALAGDKTMIRLFCVQWLLSVIHGLLAVAALLVIGFSL